MNPASLPDDGLYPMRVVARLTGLSADAIRAWQRRYGAVAPARTDGNARRFQAVDVRRLMLMKRLVDQGHAIHDVARLGEAALAALAEASASATTGAPSPRTQAGPEWQRVEAYLAAIQRFDAAQAAAQLALAATLLRPRDMALQVVLPVLREVGTRWQRGELSVVQEHLVTAQARGVLDALVRATGVDRGAERVLVTTPEGHLHEMGAMVGAMLAAARGYEVLYLGASTPEAELATAAAQAGATLVLLGVAVVQPPRELEQLAARLAGLAAQVDTWVGLAADHPLGDHLPGLRLFHRFDDLDAALLARRS